MYDLPGDPSLPPGCSQRDIDIAFGSPNDYEHEFRECDAPISHPGLCRRCFAEAKADYIQDRIKDEGLYL